MLQQCYNAQLAASGGVTGWVADDLRGSHA